MYVRVAWGRLKPGSWDEYERYYTEHILPVTQGMTGLNGRQLLRSSENPDEGISITMWDNLEALQDYDTNPQRWQGARNVEGLYTGGYWVNHFEIRSSVSYLPEK